jgi:2,3-bisphosphoglycerate-dependent phosphoglycerate mutase
MEKRIYLVRHCEAEGQKFEASLTEKGIYQAGKLAEFFSAIELDQVISSPFHRAIQSVNPLVREKGIELRVDDRLSERILSSIHFDDWQVKLEASFEDLDVTFHGGESSRQAMVRGLRVVEDVCQGSTKNTLIATHGNLMALMIKHFMPSFGFEDWKALKNPDVYLLEYRETDRAVYHLWNNKKDASSWES